MSTEVTIGTLARRAEVNIETIRYYERIGLMRRAERRSNGRRVYNASDIRTLAFIRKARELDFHIEDIRALLALRDAVQACGDVKVIASRHLEAVRVKARRAAEVERILTEALAGCPGGGPSTSCTVLKVLESVV
jgi:MerR family mercuric resistance operon transcriptional regulator